MIKARLGREGITLKLRFFEEEGEIEHSRIHVRCNREIGRNRISFSDLFYIINTPSVVVDRYSDDLFRFFAVYFSVGFPSRKKIVETSLLFHHKRVSNRLSNLWDGGVHGLPLEPPPGGMYFTRRVPLPGRVDDSSVRICTPISSVRNTATSRTSDGKTVF